MNLSEPDTPEQGTDNAQAQATDTVEDWDYYDPDEDQDTVEAPEPEATDDGTEAATDEEAAGEEEAPAEIEASIDAVVTLPDGSKAKVKDLLNDRLRQDDYSRKTQALSNDRQALRAEVERIEGITSAIVDHFTGLVPPAPDHSVALRDPAKYTREMAVHQAGMAQLQKLIELGQQPKEIKSALSKEEQARTAQEENAKLIERFPKLTQPQERQKFFTEAADAAQEFGLTMQDLQGVNDHRIFTALHYAALGLKASKAMQTAKAKVEKAPPVAPQKPAGVVRGNAEAMKKWARTPNAKTAAAAWDGVS